MNLKIGDLVTMASWTLHTPALRATYKADKKMVAVFLLLGHEPRDGSKPIDGEAVMNSLGWFRKTVEEETMRADIKAALAKFENKHYAAVQTDTKLGELDNDSNKWVSLERKSKQFWADFYAAKKELEALLEGL